MFLFLFYVDILLSCQAIREEDPERAADHVPVRPRLQHDRARTLGRHLYSGGVVSAPATQVCGGLSPQPQAG